MVFVILLSLCLSLLSVNNVLALSVFEMGSNDYFSPNDTEFYNLAGTDIISENYVISRYVDDSDDYYKLRLGIVSGNTISYQTATNLYDTNGSNPSIIYSKINETYFSYLYLNRINNLYNIQICKINADNEIVFGNNYSCVDGTGSDEPSELWTRAISLSESDYVMTFNDTDGNREIFWYEFDDMNITSLQDSIIITDNEKVHLYQNLSKTDWITSYSNKTDEYLYVNCYSIANGSIVKCAPDTLIFDGVNNATGLQLEKIGTTNSIFIKYRNNTDGSVYMKKIQTWGPALPPYKYYFEIDEEYCYAQNTMLSNFVILDSNTIVAGYRDNTTYKNYLSTVAYDFNIGNPSIESGYEEVLENYRLHKLSRLSNQKILVQGAEISGNYRRFTNIVTLSTDYEESDYTISIFPQKDNYYWFDYMKYTISSISGSSDFDYRLINETDEIIFSKNNTNWYSAITKTFYIPSEYGVGNWSIQVKPSSESWYSEEVEYSNFTVLSSGSRYYIAPIDERILVGERQGCMFSAYENESYIIQMLRLSDNETVYGYYETAIYNENRNIILEDLFLETTMTTYYLKLINNTQGSSGELLAVSIPFSIVDDSVSGTTFKVRFGSNDKTKWVINQNVEINIYQVGIGGTGKYLIYDGYEILRFSGTFTGEEQINTVMDESDVGTWTIYVYESEGSIYDENSIKRNFQVVDTTGQEINLIIGLVVTFTCGIVLAVATGIPLMFVPGSSLVAYVLSQESLGQYQLLPTELATGIIVVLVVAGAFVWLATR